MAPVVDGSTNRLRTSNRGEQAHRIAAPEHDGQCGGRRAESLHVVGTALRCGRHGCSIIAIDTAASTATRAPFTVIHSRKFRGGLIDLIVDMWRIQQGAPARLSGLVGRRRADAPTAEGGIVLDCICYFGEHCWKSMHPS